MHRESNYSSIYIIYRIMYILFGQHLKSVMMYSLVSLGGWHWHWVVSEMKTKHCRAPGSVGILSLVSSSSAMGYMGVY